MAFNQIINKLDKQQLHKLNECLLPHRISGGSRGGALLQYFVLYLEFTSLLTSSIYKLCQVHNRRRIATN